MPGLTHRQPWLLWLAAILALVAAVLLDSAHRWQTKERAADEAQLLADSHHAATALGDFFGTQQRFASELARTQAIEFLLVGRALGVPQPKATAAPPAAIEAGLRQTLKRKTVQGDPLYQRVLLLDANGAPAIDTTPGQPVPQPRPSRGSGTELNIDEPKGQIVVTAVVDVHGTPAGTLMTLADARALSGLLTAAAAEHGNCLLLIDETGHELQLPGRTPVLRSPLPKELEGQPGRMLASLDEVHGAASQAHGHDHDLAARVPVPGTRLTLVALRPAPMIEAHITPRAALYTAGAVPLLLVMAGLWRRHAQRATRRLATEGSAAGTSHAEGRHRRGGAAPETPARQAADARGQRQGDDRYRKYVEHAPHGIFVSDPAGQLVDANPSACAMVGYTLRELLGLTIADLSPPGQADAHTRLLGQVMRRGRAEAESVLRRKDGAALDIHLRARLLPGNLVMAHCVDITERKRAEEQIRRLAYFDALTGLPNRRWLMERLRRAMAEGRHTGEYGALLMLDMDKFKGLNDTHGHDAGDRLLVEVADRLSTAAPQGATVGRLGGDEFLVVVEALGVEADAAAQKAGAIGETLRQALAQPYPVLVGRPAHHSTPSLGVTIFRGQDAALEALLKQADVALYQAKSAGGNAWRLFDPQMQAAIDARQTMEADLRDALLRQQLTLHYQPQVDRERRVVGAEALLFWQPPNAEPVPPARFKTLAEQTGLIVQLGAWALERACDQLARWQAAPDTRALTLALNVSARQFLQPDFVDQVHAQLQRTGIDPSRLRLELTETLVADRLEEVIERMRELRLCGIGFSLDDFGSATASLSYLKRLPLDEVKIDQSFVRDLTRDDGATLVRAVLAMSQSLGLAVVAEGVQTEAQHAFLLQHGCQTFQGDLFGRPMPIEQWSQQLPRSSQA